MHKEMEELLPSKSAANLRRYMGGRTKTMPNDVPELTMDEIHDLVHELRP